MLCWFVFFFFNDTATTEIYTLSLHDALPISTAAPAAEPCLRCRRAVPRRHRACGDAVARQHARQGLLRRADRDRRAPARLSERRRSAPRPEPRLRRGEWRPGAARASRAAAGRRR